MGKASKKIATGKKTFFIIIFYLLLTISPYILTSYFRVGFDDAIISMLICQLSLSAYIYKKYSKEINGINFSFSISQSNIITFLILLSFCLAASVLIHIHSARSGYDSTPITVPLFIVLVLISPLYEEIFFRGFILGLISLKFNNNWIVCCFVTTLIFCALHFNSYEIYQQLNIFISGLLLYYIRRRTGGLLYPVILHSCMNFFSLTLQ